MCDTLVATGASTASGSVLFGKNSDRQRNEAQAIECVPAADHSSGQLVRCTYISIPQVEHTHAVLICRPFWMWGAEIGANEHGVVIGNEALHAKCPAPEAQALVGMDLLRLTLERATSAAEAVTILIDLLERHGQGGNCGHLVPSYYQNGFLIADPREAFVVETIGKEWLVECVQGVRAMSNRYSVGINALRVSDGLNDLIRSSGWGGEAPVNYAEVIANPSREHIGNAGSRRARSTARLLAREGSLEIADVKSILRDHGTQDHPQQEWHPECMNTRTICMHAGTGERPGQTVGALASELRAGQAVHWVTGTAATCTSIFKPVLLDLPIPLPNMSLTGSFDPSALWWRHERLHRTALFHDFARFVEDIRVERDALEAEFRARIDQVLNGGSRSDRERVVASCWRDAESAEERWSTRLKAPSRSNEEPYVKEWQKLNNIAGLALQID